MLRREAIRKIQEHANDAEADNDHDLCAVLYALSNIISKRVGSEKITTIVSLNKWPAYKNIEDITISTNDKL